MAKGSDEALSEVFVAAIRNGTFAALLLAALFGMVVVALAVVAFIDRQEERRYRLELAKLKRSRER